MSDFLDSLVAAPGTASLDIQPRMPSRYEPLPFAARECAFDGHPSGEPLETATPPEAVGPLDTADIPRRWPEPAEPGGAVHAPDRTLRSRIEAIAQQLAVVQSLRATVAAAYPSDIFAPIVPSSSPRGTEPHRAEAESLAKQQHPDIRHADLTPHIEPRSRRDASPFKGEREDTSPSTSYKPVAPDLAPVARPSIPQIVAEPAAIAQPSDGGQSTVNVTIGRLEIKAVTASPPAQPARAENRARVMSLEQYLERRTSGGVR